MIPSLGYKITHRHNGGSGLLEISAGRHQLRDRFYVQEDGDQTNSFVFCIIPRLTDEAFSSLLPQFLSEHGEATFQELVLRWTVEYIERGLHEGEFTQELNSIDLGLEDFETLRRMAREKSCDYQTIEGRDLFCSASSHLDSAKIVQVGLRFFASTSAHLCLECTLPDKKDLCSHLGHAKVSYHPLGGRFVDGAECGLRKPGIKVPAACAAGGNDCWVRTVRPRFEDRAPVYQVPMLTQALDLLDAIWRLRFDQKGRLLRLRSVANAGVLEMTCSNSEEFQVRLSALADIFESLQIDSNLVKDKDIKAEQTFKRMKAVLKGAIADEPGLNSAFSAIQKLEALNELRVAFQHTDTKANRVRAQLDLGIQFYPDVSWKQVWDDLRSRIVLALATIFSRASKVARFRLTSRLQKSDQSCRRYPGLRSRWAGRLQ